MASQWTDVVVVGGGSAGSAFAAGLARRGLGGTMLEQQREYQDGVRGEFLPVRGVSEAQRLGLADAVFSTGGVVVRWRLPYDEAWPAEIKVASARDNARIQRGVPDT